MSEMIQEALAGQQYCLHFEHVDVERRFMLRPGDAEDGALKRYAPPVSGGVRRHPHVERKGVSHNLGVIHLESGARQPLV